jgi:hypothetical protein
MYFGYATDESTYSNVMSIQNNGNTNILGDLTVTGDGNFTGTELQGDNKTMLRYSDSWLRINDDNDFVSGIYCGNRHFKNRWRLTSWG